MWQEILAMDTKFSQNMESQDLRPLYLKRRLQLLQRHQNSSIGKPKIPINTLLRI